MPDLADLYPGFASHWIDTSAGRIFTRGGGKGPPLLLLHGYPQTNVSGTGRSGPTREDTSRHLSGVTADFPCSISDKRRHCRTGGVTARQTKRLLLEASE